MRYEHTHDNSFSSRVQLSVTFLTTYFMRFFKSLLLHISLQKITIYLGNILGISLMTSYDYGGHHTAHTENIHFS